MNRIDTDLVASTRVSPKSLPNRPSSSKRILFVCGSMNQTTQMHQIARHLPDCDRRFTPFYCGAFLRFFQRRGVLDFTILGKPKHARVSAYLEEHGLELDYEGRNGPYDLVVTCNDVIIPKNLQNTKIVLIQEGMVDPTDWKYHLVRMLHMPRYLGSTSMIGQSKEVTWFCVASEGFRDLLVQRGVQPKKILVTGIPNFDCFSEIASRNTFPHRHYVLVTTSDSRETYRYENRKALIRRALEIAGGRTVIFKLHPFENVERARREVERWAPGSIVFADGNTAEMIANCDVLIATYSTTVLAGVVLGKEVHSKYDIEELRRLAPLQNGRAAQNIAVVCRKILEEQPVYA
ncbi:MAG TPA: hypothetical protein VIH68_06705 [Bacteroidota bacterium]